MRNGRIQTSVPFKRFEPAAIKYVDLDAVKWSRSRLRRKIFIIIIIITQ
jgi:hypothetical protein